MSQFEFTHVRIHTTDPKLTHGELLLASPLSAIAQGGTFQLLESAVILPLVTGDVVRARRDDLGDLIVTGIESYRAAAHALASFTPLEDEDEVEFQLDEIEAEGFDMTLVGPGLIVGHHDLKHLPDPGVFPYFWHVHLSSPSTRETMCRRYFHAPPLARRSA